VRSPGVLEAVERVQTGHGSQSVEFSVPGVFESSYKAFVSSVAWSGLESGPQEFPILVVIYDLTSMKRVEQMRVDFIANASHELRTPLASMAGFIQTLRGPAKDDEKAREKFLKIMDEQASRMGRLIGDLLSLSRIELNEHVLPNKAVRIDMLLSDVVDAFAPMAKDANVELTITGDGEACVAGDRDELVQVFQNLIDNALHYGGKGERIVVDIRSAMIDQPGAANQDMVRISVQDFGPGIEREHIPRLTERFYRVDVDQSRRSGGTGLGLAIVKHIVMRHRGFLEIQSDKGKGSMFIVSLPRLTGTVEEAQESHGATVTTLNIPAPKPAPVLEEGASTKS
jgi:two-component system phosphate regulon sensor histidine kinase PhoR